MTHVRYTGIHADPELRKTALEIGRRLPMAHKRETDTGGYTLNWSCRHPVGQYYGQEWYERVLRLEFHHEWVWDTHPYADLIRRLVEPFTSQYYEVLTRIQAIFYPPGVANTVHRDRMVGQLYDEGMNITAGFGHCDFDTWKALRQSGDMRTDIRFHESQGFQSGRLYLADSSKLIYTDDAYTDKDNVYLPLAGNHVYNPGGEFFLASDNQWHSGHPEDHWRAILFFDGKFRSAFPLPS